MLKAGKRIDEPLQVARNKLGTEEDKTTRSCRDDVLAIRERSKRDKVTNCDGIHQQMHQMGRLGIHIEISYIDEDNAVLLE